MDLRMSKILGAGYKSRTQQARVVTEAWASSNLYCVACDSSNLVDLPRNEPAADLACTNCASRYQLKASGHPFGRRVVDSAYSTMTAAIQSDSAPNLFLLHYDKNWFVVSLTLIPRFCFTIAAIEKRKPLGPTARRAGWIGCNILLNAIAPDAKIPVVRDCNPSQPSLVRDSYRRLLSLTALKPEFRGWTLNVLNLVRTLNKPQFTLNDVYNLEPSLAQLYPENRNIRPKIRQQLQLLRDAGIIVFTGRGRYAFQE